MESNTYLYVDRVRIELEDTLLVSDADINPQHTPVWPQKSFGVLMIAVVWEQRKTQYEFFLNNTPFVYSLVFV